MHLRHMRRSSADIVEAVARERITLLHLLDRLAECGLNGVEVRLGMRGCEEAGVSLLNMNALFAHRVIQQTAEERIAVKPEVKPGRKVINPAWHAAFDKEIVQRGRDLSGLPVQFELKLRANGLQMIQNGTSCSKRKRVSNKRTSKEGDPYLRYRRIAILPGA